MTALTLAHCSSSSSSEVGSVAEWVPICVIHRARAFPWSNDTKPNFAARAGSKKPVELEGIAMVERFIA